MLREKAFTIKELEFIPQSGTQGQLICYQKIPLFQFPEDHQSNITNSVNLRVDTLQEIKISISMVSNSTAWMYAYGCKYTVNKCTSTIMITPIDLAPEFYMHYI